MVAKVHILYKYPPKVSLKYSLKIYNFLIFFPYIIQKKKKKNSIRKSFVYYDIYEYYNVIDCKCSGTRAYIICVYDGRGMRLYYYIIFVLTVIISRNTRKVYE